MKAADETQTTRMSIKNASRSKRKKKHNKTQIIREKQSHFLKCTLAITLSKQRLRRQEREREREREGERETRETERERQERRRERGGETKESESKHRTHAPTERETREREERKERTHTQEKKTKRRTRNKERHMHTAVKEETKDLGRNIKMICKRFACSLSRQSVRDKIKNRVALLEMIVPAQPPSIGA